MSLNALRALCACFSLFVVTVAVSPTAVLAEPAQANPSPPTSDEGVQVARVADAYVGSPYVWGGASPAGFDCTGFVQWVYSQVGVSLPRTEAGQLSSGAPVAVDDLRPGDIVVFANTYRAGLSHTGIYLGDGEFVHAVDESHGVLVSAIGDTYWSARFVGASRPEA